MCEHHLLIFYKSIFYLCLVHVNNLALQNRFEKKGINQFIKKLLTVTTTAEAAIVNNQTYNMYLAYRILAILE